MRFVVPLTGLCLLASPSFGHPQEGTGDQQRRASSYGSGFSATDRQRAERFLDEAARLCSRDGGRLWGLSLCGPIAIVVPTTRSLATNEPPPPVAQPAAFGFSNSAVTWGGRMWTTVMWQQMVMAEEQGHGAGWLLMHELFHRIQPQLGLLLADSNTDHLDTVEGRYWVQLEWRALEAALRDPGKSATRALRDALAFRAARRAAFSSAAENERVAEINEGLAEYTGIATAASSPEERATRAIERMRSVLGQTTLVRSFAYGSGAAYGVLLERWRPGWTRQFTSKGDLSNMLAAVARLQPSLDVKAAAARYGAAALRVAEESREQKRRVRVARLQRQFVDGPVLVLPRAPTFTFAGDVTPIGAAGSIYPGIRAQAEWGTLESTEVLVAADGKTMAVPAPVNVEGPVLTGDGWKLVLTAGWRAAPGKRPGDFQIAR